MHVGHNVCIYRVYTWIVSSCTVGGCEYIYTYITYIHIYIYIYMLYIHIHMSQSNLSSNQAHQQRKARVEPPAEPPSDRPLGAGGSEAAGPGGWQVERSRNPNGYGPKLDQTADRPWFHYPGFHVGLLGTFDPHPNDRTGRKSRGVKGIPIKLR